MLGCKQIIKFSYKVCFLCYSSINKETCFLHLTILTFFITISHVKKRYKLRILKSNVRIVRYKLRILKTNVRIVRYKLRILKTNIRIVRHKLRIIKANVRIVRQI